MHELSIAESLLELAKRHTPAGTALRSVRVKVGPLRAVDADSLQWAWESTLTARNLPPIALDVQQLPWNMRCPGCQREWNCDDLAERCTCGCVTPHPVGGNELELVSVEVDEPQVVSI